VSAPGPAVDRNWLRRILQYGMVALAVGAPVYLLRNDRPKLESPTPLPLGLSHSRPLAASRAFDELALKPATEEGTRPNAAIGYVSEVGPRDPLRPGAARRRLPTVAETLPWAVNQFSAPADVASANAGSLQDPGGRLTIRFR
jgi:hypothetical protein